MSWYLGCEDTFSMLPTPSTLKKLSSNRNLNRYSGTWAVEIMGDGGEYYRKQMPESHEDCKKLFRKRDCMIHPTVIFRRSYIEKSGLYSLDTYFGEDTMMWAQGFVAGCVFANVPEYLSLKTIQLANIVSIHTSDVLVTSRHHEDRKSTRLNSSH